MKNIKNVVKKSCLLVGPVLRSLACALKPWRKRGVVGLVAAVFVGNIIAMRMTPQQVERGKAATKQVMTQMEERKKQYFIHETDNPANGIWVDKDFVKQNSKSIKLMVEDLGEELNAIPLPTSVEIIKLGFEVLQNKKDVKDLSFAELVDVANLFNFLDVPADALNAVVVRIKGNIDTDPNNIAANETLKKLNPDLQKLIMTEPIINCLKDCIAQKYTKNRGKPLAGHPDPVTAVAFSPDGTKILSGCYTGGGLMNKNVILWDVSNPNNINQHAFWLGLDSRSVAFSPDSKQVVANSDVFNALFLWKITDLNEIKRSLNIAHNKFGEDQDRFDLVVFSPDGKNVFSLGNDFIVWDISNLDNNIPNIIFQQSLPLGDAKAFSPDSKLVASARPDTLLIFDVSGPIVHPYLKVEKHLGAIKCLAFSPDGKTVVSYGDKLILWDVSDLNNIKSRMLLGVLDLTEEMNIPKYTVGSMVFSHDGKKIALCCADGFILVDINDPHNIIRFDNCGMYVHSIAFNPDGRQIVTGGKSAGMFGKNLILWTLITDQEQAMLNQIKNYNADQVRLIYQLCLQSSRKQAIALKKGSEELQIFKTLSEDMQKLLSDLFLPKGWFSGWWS